MKRLIMIMLTVCILAGCSGAGTAVNRELWAMDTYMQLQITGPQAEEAAAQLESMILQLEEDWSVTRPNSLPNAAQSASLTQEQSQMFDQIHALIARTDRLFDYSMGGVMEAWGFYSKQYRVPSQEELEAGRRKNRIDLGGALKGYCSNRAVEILDSLDIRCALLSLGGSIQTYGTKADGTPWQIGIQSPQGGDPAAILSVSGTLAIVTSGDYQRYFVQDGVRYHHILDPRTLRPADSDLSSVTILCENGLTADCLSTALFVMGLEDATDFWRRSDDFEAVFITTDGRIYATEGVLLSGCEYEVIGK